MKTVILVGAGATLAEALPGRPARDRLPPLDATFFDLCQRASLTGVQALRRYMRADFGLDPFDGTFRMEEIFNYVYSEAFAEAPSNECLDAYWSLIRMYAAAIARTTNSLTGTSGYGVGAVLRHHLKSGYGPDLTFVTFNQDLVIEKAVQAAHDTARYADLPWDFRRCYGFSFHDHTALRGSTQFDYGAGASVSILKLHGSLNWMFNVRSGTDPRNAIRRPSGKLHLLNSTRVVADLQFNTGARKVDITPLVIPPIYEKASRYQKAVAPAWAAARRALENCERLVILGYSFPDADFAARSMLRSTLHKNATLNEVHVVDPSCDTLARVARLTSRDCTLHYTDVKAYVRSHAA